MKMYLALGGAALVLALGVHVSYAKQAAAHECLDASNPRKCFTKETEAVIERDGTQAALTYVWDTVARHSDYKTAHMALHYVGAQAYRDAGSVEEAFAYLRGLGSATNELFSGGFQHGVFQGYFLENDSRVVPDLTKDLCGRYENFATLDDAFDLQIARRAAECYHTIGHATMMLQTNDLEPSLAECDAFPHSWMREWCYHGVFMENFYLYSAYYQEDAARPDAQEPSLAPTCERLPGRYREQCVYFVSWVYLLAHPKEFSKAFAECALFPDALARICVARAGRFYVAEALKSDLSGIHAVCTEAGKFENECIFGTAIGLSEGIGALTDEGAGKRLCETLGPKERASCEYTLAHTRDSLARLVVIDL